MTQLDPFIIYTVKLAMDFRSSEPDSPIPSSTTTQNELTPPSSPTLSKANDNHTNPMFPDTMARIMSIKQLPVNPGDTVPRLRKDNIFALLYHADEQWSSSTLDLSNAVRDSTSNTEQQSKFVQPIVEQVHHQQRIYLDTLHLLHKAVNPKETNHKRFNEPIWYAAQVLNSQCQIRHLECFTDVIAPLATRVHEALENLRYVSRCLVQQQQHLKQQRLESLKTQQKRENIFSTFFSSFSKRTNEYEDELYYDGMTSTEESNQLLRTLEPHLTAFADHWSTFEKALYGCYVHTVFGKYHTDVIMEDQQQKSTNVCDELIQQRSEKLPYEFFHDNFTQLLPITLERAINLQIVDVNDIQSLDPIAFVAVPRLAILAGMTWLAHLTGWRNNHKSTHVPVWLKPHKDALQHVALLFDQLETQLLKTQSEDDHHSFVQVHQSIEQALVSGNNSSSNNSDKGGFNGKDSHQRAQLGHLEKSIYLGICMIADSVLSSNRAQAFSIVLCHLFKHFGLKYDIQFEESEDAVPLEHTIFDLAI